MRRAPRMAVCGVVLGVFAAAPAPVGTDALARIEAIRSVVHDGRVSVIIATSEPVAYVTSRPDPFTVLVDVRNASAEGLVNELATAAPSPLANVDVETARDSSGRALVRLRVLLVAPVAHHVESSSSEIRIDLDASAPVAASAPAPPPVAAAPRAVTRARSEPATLIRAIRTSAGPGEVRVTLSANGTLTPRRIAEAADPPPRLVLDFPNLRANVPAVTTVNLGPVRQIRVAAHSHSPLVTRVVFDLKQASNYRVEQAPDGSRDLSVVFPLEPSGSGPIVGEPRAVAVAESAPVLPASTGGPEADLAAATLALPAIDPVVPLGPAEGMRDDAGGLILPVPVGRGAVVPAEATGVGPVSLVDLPITVLGSGPTGTTVPAQVLPPIVEPPVPQPQTPPAVGGQTFGGTPATEFTGDPVSLDFQNADLRAVLRTFAEISSLNIVIDPTVQGSVDVSLRDVPWDQAFDIILRANSLGYTVDGTVVRIAPLTVLADEQAQRRKLDEERALSGELIVLPRTLSYARAEDMADLLTRSVLSPRGQIQIDERTNTLIISDLAENVGSATELIDTLDRTEPQVEIEARIITTTSSYARSLGVQWGLNGRIAPELANTTSLSFPNRGSLTGRTGGTQGPVGVDSRAIDTETSGTAVNLPVSAATGAIGLTLGAVNGAFNLDVALSALESSGNGRILSTPRVTTQNNVQAEVKQGIQIPIQTVANNTVTVTFKDAALSLRVTPQITASDTVIMQIILENAAPDFSREVNGIPPIDTQSASTTVQVDDGATTVIGGIVIANDLSSQSRIPYLSRIPLLGWLFRRDSDVNSNRELLIFITPRIIR